MIASILPVPTFSCSGEHTMFGPGEYVPDPTEGIVDIEDLPRPQLVAYSRNHEHTLCPRCDHLPYRPASWHLWRDHRVFVPFATIQNWTESGGKKGARADGRRVSGLGTGVVFGLRGG